MARGRVINPDFWTDGNMVGVSPLARLFYIGMWNFAHCDKGHLDDDAMGLKLKILPADQVDPDELLSELMERKRIIRVQASNGKTFLTMPSFARWQKTDPRWKTRCPACALSNSEELTGVTESFTESHQSSALREEKRNGEKRNGEKQTTSLAATDRDLIALFDSAYSHWPKKVKRDEALAKFKGACKANKAMEIAVHITRFGDAYKATTDKQFVPALGVWLSGKRWTDDLPTAPQDSSKPTPTDRATATLGLATDIDMREIEQ